LDKLDPLDESHSLWLCLGVWRGGRVFEKKKKGQVDEIEDIEMKGL